MTVGLLERWKGGDEGKRTIGVVEGMNNGPNNEFEGRRELEGEKQNRKRQIVRTSMTPHRDASSNRVHTCTLMTQEEYHNAIAIAAKSS